MSESEVSDLIILQGLPRSGKSSYSKLLREQGYEILSVDDYRLKFTGKIYDEDSEPAIWDIVRNDALDMLVKGDKVVIDECNPTKLCLDFWMKLKSDIPILNIEVIRIETDINICMQRTDNEILKNAINRKFNCLLSINDLKDYCSINDIKLNIKYEF